MGTVVMKDVLKCAKIRLGGLSVMTSGQRKTPTWLADKLDSLVLVNKITFYFILVPIVNILK